MRVPNLASHARRARQAMTSRVSLLPADAGDVPVWTGPAKITPSAKDARVVALDSGGIVNLQTYDVDLPLGTPAPADTGWRVRVVESRDPRLVGRDLWVIDQPLNDWAVTVKLVAQTQT